MREVQLNYVEAIVQKFEDKAPLMQLTSVLTLQEVRVNLSARVGRILSRNTGKHFQIPRMQSCTTLINLATELSTASLFKLQFVEVIKSALDNFSEISDLRIIDSNGSLFMNKLTSKVE